MFCTCLTRIISCVAAAAISAASVLPAFALDQEHHDRAVEALQKAHAYLKTKQNADGSWTPQPGPAITAMVVRGMLMSPTKIAKDPAVNLGVEYVLSKARPDGGIHEGMLENYNTAICLSTLALVRDKPGVPEKIKAAQDYLRGLQWSSQPDPSGKAVDASHPFYGGAGYGKHGRPDMSNTQFMLEGLYDSGLDCNDPAFQRALVFISRCQGVASNKEFGDKITQDGGFIYATSINKDLVGVPQSMANPESEDAAKKGLPVSNLRTYGSMTYAGFKSYLYAQLSKDDPRVTEAFKWITSHYNLEANPGMPDAARMQGYYYYLLTFSRALDAWGQERITLTDGKERNWKADLIDQLAKSQNPDGSWVNTADRWMEGDPVLTTAYAILALNHALE